jgi:hypothetical protein
LNDTQSSGGDNADDDEHASADDKQVVDGRMLLTSVEHLQARFQEEGLVLPTDDLDTDEVSTYARTMLVYGSCIHFLNSEVRV